MTNNDTCYTKTFVANDEKQHLDLPVNRGDMVIRHDLGQQIFVNVTGNNSSMEDWTLIHSITDCKYIIRGHHISRMLSLWGADITEEEFLSGKTVDYPVHVFWDQSSTDIYGPDAGRAYYQYCKSFKPDDVVRVIADFDDMCNHHCRLRHWCGKLSHRQMCEWYYAVTGGKYVGYHPDHHDYCKVDKDHLKLLNLTENALYAIHELYQIVVDTFNFKKEESQ